MPAVADLVASWMDRVPGVVARGPLTVGLPKLDFPDGTQRWMPEARWLLKRSGARVLRTTDTVFSAEDRADAGLWGILLPLAAQTEEGGRDIWAMKGPPLVELERCSGCGRRAPRLARAGEVHLMRRGPMEGPVGRVGYATDEEEHLPGITLMASTLWEALNRQGVARGLTAWPVLLDGRHQGDLVALTAKCIGQRVGRYGYSEACSVCFRSQPRHATDVIVYSRPPGDALWYSGPVHGPSHLLFTKPVYAWFAGAGAGMVATSSGEVPEWIVHTLDDAHPDWGFIDPVCDEEREPDWAALGMQRPPGI